MLNFLTFLTEAIDSEHDLVHHHVITHGNEGAASVGHILDATHRHLLGKTSAIKLTTEYDDDKADPVHKADPTNYSIGEQRRYLNHMENAKRVYSKMKPESLGIVGRQKYQLKHYLHGLTLGSEPPTADGYLDHLAKQHDKRTDKNDRSHEEDKKRLSYSDSIKHVIANQSHFENAIEMHYHLRRAQNTLASVIGKNYKSAGRSVGRNGVVATGHMGTARIKRHD